MKSVLKNDPSFLDRVREFVVNKSGTQNRWINGDHMEVYLRFRQRMFLSSGGARYRWTIDVANVNVVTTGVGVYSDFLKFVEENTTASVVYVENIHDQNQCALYERRGYVYDESTQAFTDLVKCMFKSIGEKS